MAEPLSPLSMFRANVELLAEERGVPLEDAFGRYAVELLEELGELSGPELLPSRVGRIIAADWDADTGRLTLVGADFAAQGWGKERDRAAITALVASLNDQSARIMRSAREGFSGTASRRSGVPLADAAELLLQYVRDVHEHVQSIRLLAVTNASTPERRGEVDPVLGVPVAVVVRDVGELSALGSQSAMQDVTLDLSEAAAGGLPVLGPVPGPAFESYLVVLPGELIADLYQAHGSGVLGRNVRAFLQVSNRVNKGIAQTLKDDPKSFFAFNNGLSLTARSVERSLVRGQMLLTALTGLEIVNGGQTTATLHRAKYRDRVDLSQVSVQAKLTVLPSTGSDDIALDIARYANSQSPVRMGDLSSNSPFFSTLEKLSRTVAFGEQDRQWYFERLRGQYASARDAARAGGAEPRFLAAFAPDRRFEKSDIAKVELAWLQYPQSVAAGNEKSLSVFMNLRNGPAAGRMPDDAYFRRLVGKLILWRAADRVIGSLKLGGYKALDVAYTVSLLAHLTGGRVDFTSVADNQDAGDAWRDAVATLAPLVHANLLAGAGARNVSTWAKSSAAWDEVKSISWDAGALVGAAAAYPAQPRAVVARGESAVDLAPTEEEIEGRERVEELGAQAWFQLSAWAKEAGHLQGWQRGIAFSVGKKLSLRQPPTEKQVAQAVIILDEARRLGFVPSESD